MNEAAAHLNDRILPSVPLRQWVVTFPGWLAVRLAFDASLAAGRRTASSPAAPVRPTDPPRTQLPTRCPQNRRGFTRGATVQA